MPSLIYLWLFWSRVQCSIRAQEKECCDHLAMSAIGEKEVQWCYSLCICHPKNSEFTGEFRSLIIPVRIVRKIALTIAATPDLFCNGKTPICDIELKNGKQAAKFFWSLHWWRVTSNNIVSNISYFLNDKEW